MQDELPFKVRELLPIVGLKLVNSLRLGAKKSAASTSEAAPNDQLNSGD
jgi:hypothetical protein